MDVHVWFDMYDVSLKRNVVVHNKTIITTEIQTCANAVVPWIYMYAWGIT